jgi:hypothetical protein
MWGVTRKVALQEGYTGDMHVLPRDTAKAIYLKRYWQPMRCDSMPDQIKFSLFDAAVNDGVKQAVIWLQRAMDVGDDGVLGPLTLDAAQRANGLRLALKFQHRTPGHDDEPADMERIRQGLDTPRARHPENAGCMKYALIVGALVVIVLIAAAWLRYRALDPLDVDLEK